MNLNKTIPLCFLPLFPFSVFATDHESSSGQAQKLEGVYVNGASNELALKDMPIRTEVITKVELERIHARTLDDALRYTAGIDLKPIGNDAENGSGVSIQGLDPSQVLIMIDGNPVAPNSGEMVDTVDITQILIGDVERIEIIKGGASAIYGANAMGGVVNIVTKNPDKPLSLSADISGGNWGDQSNKRPLAKDNTILSASTRLGKFSAQLTANFLNQEGYDTDPEEMGTDGWHGYKNNYSAKFLYRFNQNHQITVAPTFYRAETATHKQSQDIFKTMKENSVKRERDTWDLSYKGKVEDFNYKLHLMDQVYDELVDGTVSRLDQTSKNRNYDIKVNKPFGDSHLLSFSLEQKDEFLSQYNLAKAKFEIEDKSKQSTDVSLNHSWFVTDNIELMPAIRFNEDEYYGSHLSPMLSMMYSNTEWTDGRVNIRASIADGYKTPTLKQMYWEFDHGSLWMFGNPELAPERSTSTQLGIEYLTNQNSRFEVSFFNNNIRNLIDTESNPEKAKDLGIATALEYTNVDNARTRGFDVSYRKTFEYIGFNSSYSFLDATNLDTGKALPKKSKHQAQLSVDFFNYKNMHISLKYRFNSKQYIDSSNDKYVDDYDVVDFKFNQKLNKTVAWYFGIDNLFNKFPQEYTSTGGHGKSGNDIFPNSPRYMYLGIRLKH